MQQPVLKHALMPDNPAESESRRQMVPLANRIKLGHIMLEQGKLLYKDNYMKSLLDNILNHKFRKIGWDDLDYEYIKIGLGRENI